MSNFRRTSLLLSSILVLGFSGPAFAQTPPDVLAAYKSYTAAMQTQNYTNALKSGKKAWQLAEKSVGDSKLTGDLAFNYGMLANARGKSKDAIKALARASDLAMTGREKGAEVRLEREVELISALERSGGKAKPRIDSALNFARSQGLGNSVFAGELLVHETNSCNQRANRTAKGPKRNRLGSRVDRNKDPENYTAKVQAKCAKIAREALNIFKSNPNISRPTYVAAASNTIGNAYERKNEWINAALAYQDSRVAIEKPSNRTSALVSSTVGRWLNARTRIDKMGKLDQAKQQGLKDMWPITSDSPKVKALKRVEADFATSIINTRRLSGHTILQVDVTDGGQPTNIRVLDSWPDGGYDKMSIEAMQQWQFPPKQGSEPAGFRKDLAIPFSYIVYDRETQDVY